jgi:glycerophosphoryl diester phosphodiesterase
VQIPTLNDLLELVCRPEHQSAHLMLEMKSDPDEPDPETARKKLVSSVIQQVRSTDLSNRTLLHSFDWHLLKEAQLIAPDLPTSYLTQLPTNSEAIGEDSSKEIGPNLLGREAETPDLVAEAGGSLWCPFYCDLSAKGLKRARELGLLVAVWTVNDYDDIDAMIDLGVDAIISDYPGRVQRKLRDKGYQWNLPVA